MHLILTSYPFSPCFPNHRQPHPRTHKIMRTTHPPLLLLLNLGLLLLLLPSSFSSSIHTHTHIHSWKTQRLATISSRAPFQGHHRRSSLYTRAPTHNHIPLASLPNPLSLLKSLGSTYSTWLLDKPIRANVISGTLMVALGDVISQFIEPPGGGAHGHGKAAGGEKHARISWRDLQPRRIINAGMCV